MSAPPPRDDRPHDPSDPSPIHELEAELAEEKRLRAMAQAEASGLATLHYSLARARRERDARTSHDVAVLQRRVEVAEREIARSTDSVVRKARHIRMVLADRVGLTIFSAEERLSAQTSVSQAVDELDAAGVKHFLAHQEPDRG